MSSGSEVEALLDRLEEIASFGDYNYSWWEFVAWYDPQARIYYWYSDGGCSCTSFMDSVESISELSVGRKEEPIAAVREYADQPYEGYGAALDVIRNYKAAA